MIASKLKRLVEGATGTTVDYATEFGSFSAYYEHTYVQCAQT